MRLIKFVVFGDNTCTNYYLIYYKEMNCTKIITLRVARLTLYGMLASCRKQHIMTVAFIDFMPGLETPFKYDTNRVSD